MIKPSDISYDDTALIVAGQRFPCKRPRLAFARKLKELFGDQTTHSHHVGTQGFGFERDENGVPVRIPHLGGVHLGVDVEIGRCTVIARGTIGDTVIGDHVKLDDHVFVAHNVEIGESTMVVAGAVICGSVKIGKRCWVGAGAMIKEHVKIGDDATIGMGAVVLKDVDQGTTVVGNPARVLR